MIDDGFWTRPIKRSTGCVRRRYFTKSWLDLIEERVDVELLVEEECGEMEQVLCCTRMRAGGATCRTRRTEERASE